MRTRAIRFRAVAATSVLLLTLTATGCYRATVETGRPASGQTVTNQWAHSFIGGLIPPATVNTAAQCPAGVARVVTEHSVLNMIAAIITFNLYTPMTITVDCAAPGSAMMPAGGNMARLISLPAGSSKDDLEQALNLAAKRASDLGQPVYVDFSALE